MSKIVEIAKAEIGTTEVPKDSNLTKYGKWFGLQGVAWCGIFVSWCYAMRGKPLPNIGFKKGFAGCQTAVAYFKKNNRIVTKPNPGDIVFFDWNNDGVRVHFVYSLAISLNSSQSRPAFAIVRRWSKNLTDGSNSVSIFSTSTDPFKIYEEFKVLRLMSRSG